MTDRLTPRIDPVDGISPAEHAARVFVFAWHPAAFRDLRDSLVAAGYGPTEADRG